MSEEIKNVAIQQINVGYNAPEDRLLLKIGMSNNAELNVWLTRKVVKVLWQLLQDTNLGSTSAPEGERTLAQQLNFSEGYKKRDPVSHEGALLAHDCRIITIENNLPALELICTSGQTVKVALNQDLSLALINMLQMVTKEAAWDLAYSEQPSLLSPATANTVLH